MGQTQEVDEAADLREKLATANKRAGGYRSQLAALKSRSTTPKDEVDVVAITRAITKICRDEVMDAVRKCGQEWADTSLNPKQMSQKLAAWIRDAWRKSDS